MASQNMSWQDDVREKRKQALEIAKEHEQLEKKRREIIQVIWNKILEANSKLDKDIRLPVRKAKVDPHDPLYSEVVGLDKRNCLYNMGGYICYGVTFLSNNELYVKRITPKGQTINAEDGKLTIGCLDHVDEYEDEHYIDYKYDENTEHVLLRNLCMGKPIQTGLKILSKYRIGPHGKKIKEGCFIATAACGTENANDVVLLSDFRDTFLEIFLLGKYFISYYYRFSPQIAKKIENSYFAKTLTRKMFIHPIAKICKKLLQN